MDGLQQLLWLLLLLLLLLPIGQVDSAQVTGGVKGVVEPTDPLVGTGDTLVVNCTLENTGTLNINSSSIFFKFGNARLDANYVHVLDKNTAELRMPNMTRSQNSGHIFCYAVGPDGETILGHVAIQVAEYPVTPHITECRVYNWQKMICRWEPASQDTGIATNQTLYWTLLSKGYRRRKFPLVRCPHPRPNSCTWLTPDPTTNSPFLIDKVYRVIVVLSSKLSRRRLLSLKLIVNTSMRVQPNPVRNLSVSGVGKRHLQLTWLSPAHNKRILYKILYKSPWMSDPQVVNTSETTVTLQNLSPFAVYQITVTGIPLISNEAVGFWSNRSSLEHRTLEDVPGAAPVVTPGGFVTADKGAKNRSIVLHWTPIPAPLRHGVVLSTRIRYSIFDTAGGHRIARSTPTSADESVIIVTGAATYQADLLLRKDRAYRIIVDVINAAGYNSALSLQPVVIEKESAMPAKPRLFTVQGNNTGIYLNWTAVDGATNYTIYWCKGSLHDLQCKGTLKWQMLDVSSTSLAIPLYKGRYSEYIFAISVEKAIQGGPGRPDVTTSTGMLWSDCTYAIGKEVKAPKQVRFTERQGSGSLSVEWTRPSCTETGYIRNFLVVYCVQDQCEETRVDAAKKEYQIWGLHADETYKVKVVSESPHGVKASSPFIEQKVLRSGLTRGAMAGIIVAAAFVAVFILIGVIASIRKCKKSVDHYKTLGIAPPERPVTTLPPRRVEEDDDTMPDPTVDGSVPYFVPNHSGQSRVRENFENDELERDHHYHNNVYPGRHHSGRCQSVDSGPDASIYSIDTVMSTLESSAGSRLDDVFVDSAKGTARFYSVAPSNSLDIVPEEMSLLNHQPSGGAVAGAAQAQPSRESEGDGKMAEVNDRLLEQNGDIDDSMLESAAVHNLQMLLQANNNNANGTPGQALKGSKPLLPSGAAPLSSSSRPRELRENSVQSDDGVVSTISPYCQVDDVPNGNAAGTALSSGGYVHHGSVLIAGGVDNRNNANNNNNVHLGGASIHSSDSDNLNAPFLSTEESDGSAMSDGVPPSGPSEKTPTTLYNNGVGVSWTEDSVGNEDALDDTGTKHCHSDSHLRLNSAGYVTEVLGTPPSGSPLRPMPAADGYVTLDDVTVQSDPESGSDVSSSSGLGDTASSPQCIAPLPCRDSHSSVDSDDRDTDPVNFTSPTVAPPGATTWCNDNPGGASVVPDCFRGNHFPCDSRESSPGKASVPPSEHERLLANDDHDNATSMPLRSPQHGPNGSCGKAYQDPGYTQVVDPDRWPRAPHNVPSGYVTLPPILQNGITGATTS